jgi:hypothetical protein
MRADEARAITVANLCCPVIDHWVRALSKKIREIAESGRSSIDPWAWLVTLRMPGPMSVEKDAIAQHFQKLGYKVTNHTDPDPGHPCSGPYTTLSW